MFNLNNKKFVHKQGEGVQQFVIRMSEQAFIKREGGVFNDTDANQEYIQEGRKLAYIMKYPIPSV